MEVFRFVLRSGLQECLVADLCECVDVVSERTFLHVYMPSLHVRLLAFRHHRLTATAEVESEHSRCMRIAGRKSPNQESCSSKSDPDLINPCSPERLKPPQSPSGLGSPQRIQLH